jgi:EAL domain-containing protein (putative c-di-GMP-specific phosphodiesterase class I)
MKKYTLRKAGKRIVVSASILLIGVLAVGTFQDIRAFVATPGSPVWDSVFQVIVSSTALIILSSLLVLLARSNSKAHFWLVHDSVTNLPRKTEIPRAIVKGSTAYVFIRLKEYYQYLERYGLSISDSFIRTGAKVIQDVYKQYIHNIYQFSDTEFLVITNYQGDAEEILQKFQQLAEIITEKVYEINSTEGVRGTFILSIGIAPVSHTSNVELLTVYAKFASLEAGQNAGPATVLFDLPRYLAYRAVMTRRYHVHEVIENAEVSTVFQPIIACDTGELYGYEALTRPTNPAFKDIVELLDDAEILGVYTQLELLMTLTAIQSFRKLNAAHTRLFINFAPESIKKRIYDNSSASGVFDNIKFVIEITERGEIFPDVVSLLDTTIAKLNALIALDDFGTGYSNHLALLNSKPDIVKVSQELIKDIATNIDKQQVYENTVSFARGLGILVLAEGIETREEFETCLRLGMDFAQGYYIGKPIKEIAVLPSEIREILNHYEAFNLARIQKQYSLRDSFPVKHE